MNIIKKMFTRKPAYESRYSDNQKWVLHNDDGVSQVTHILNISRVADGQVEFIEHTSWANNGPEDDEDDKGYKQISHSFEIKDFNKLVMTQGFILLRND